MADTNPRLTRYIATAVIYLALVGSVFGFNIIRSRAARNAAQPAQPEPPTTVSSTKPYFSLTTNRSYSPSESARLWASYQNIDYLDFRVYRVKDPNKFFKQLDDPRNGRKERADFPGLARGFTARMYVPFETRFLSRRDYVRTNLMKAPPVFNEKFRKERRTRTPLPWLTMRACLYNRSES